MISSIISTAVSRIADARLSRAGKLRAAKNIVRSTPAAGLHIYMCVYISLSLSLYIYIYIHIFTYIPILYHYQYYYCDSYYHHYYHYFHYYQYYDHTNVYHYCFCSSRVAQHCGDLRQKEMPPGDVYIYIYIYTHVYIYIYI